ncbi:MAG: FG-GAP-like repeat-containing protein [Planctomycetota bacterium]|jgi:hypothetical protein
MRRIAALFLLLSIATAEEKRDVAAVLADHALALGDAAKVRSLRAVGELSVRKGKPHTAEIFLLADGSCLRQFPRPDGRPSRLEYAGREGVFVNQGGAFHRYRPGQSTTRGFNYLSRALARPFPLLPYVRKRSTHAALRLGFAEGFEVLVAPNDEQGIHARYWLSTKNHLIERIDFESEPDKPFVIITFRNHRDVNGVVLPHFAGARYVQLAVDPEKKKLVSLELYRTELYREWLVNPDLSQVHFRPPGLGRGGAEGFERTVLKTGPDPRDVAVGDLDGDGARDIAVACWGGVYVHFGGAFTQAPVRVEFGRAQHRGLVIEDLDRDGRAELVGASTVEPGDRYYLATFGADRKCETRIIVGAPPLLHSLSAVDLDFDGLGDLVATGREQVSIKFGNGSGGVRVVGSIWPLRTKEHPLAAGLGLDLGHMDKDRLWDIAVADGSRVIVFQGEMNLSFQPRVSLRAGPQPVDVVFTDLNGDGLDDLVVANEKPTEDLQGDLAVLLNTGDGLKQHHYVEAGVRTPDLEVGHLDGDAHVDVAVASRLSGEVTLLYGDGEGKLGRAERLPSGRGTCRLAVTDLDGDGRDDILAANGLDDTVAIFLNRREIPGRRPRPSARATVCESFVEPEFRLEGLSRPYEFVAEFRLPAGIREPSGIAWLGGIGATQLILVSDDDAALHRATLDRGGTRLLVGPRIPLQGAPGGALDLEAAAFDRWSGNLFLASERDSTILRTTLWGQVLGIAKTSIEATENDGIEGLALRRMMDNTPLLYVLRERMGKSLEQPPVHVYGIEEDSFGLKLRLKTHLPVNLADQSGAAVLGDSFLVVGRLTRSITEARLGDDEGFAPGAKSAGLRELNVDLLGLAYKDNPLLGMVEGIAADEQSGALFLVVDNNGKSVGHEGRNRGPEGRLIWLRSLAKEQARIEPRRVVARQILIPWKGDREEGLRIARECYERARGGEEFDQLAARYHSQDSRFPALLRVVTPPANPAVGEQARASLPTALAKVLFALEAGEVGLCEFHRVESPEGWYVVLRIE